MITKQEFPKFIQNKPQGLDKYEGLSANRIADAIKDHIERNVDEDKLSKIIGLEGEWGSGKSNIIKILSNELGDSYYLFEYDAWGHQEDLQRRSFLQSLTTELIDKKILKGVATINTIEGKEQKVKWEYKLKYLLAKKVETETTSYPKIGIGVAVSFLTAVLTPIFVFIAYALKPLLNDAISTWASIFISIFPVFISLIIWGYYVKKYPGKYKKLDFFLAVYQDKVVEGIEFETISENEPSVSEFKRWMNDVSDALSINNKKLIIVYDNMDRLPADKVKELWSSIHTFFSEDGYKNIWVIIPFDRAHLATAFNENSNANKTELTCHFINKTFPVIYRVAPPVLTDWKKVFNEYFEDAFGNTEEEDKETIQRIFGITKAHFTPRDIIAFINEIVSLKRTWNDEIPILYFAIFALNKDEILKAPIEMILSGEYLISIERIINNSEKLQGFIAAITYGIDVKMAEQIPLKQYLQKTLKGENNYDINKYSDHKHFVSILDNEIKDFDIALIDKAIISLSLLDKTKGIEVTKQWNELVKLYIHQQALQISFEKTHQELLKNSDDKNKKNILKYLCEKFRNLIIVNGVGFYHIMYSLDKYIEEQNLNISTIEYIKKKEVSPEEFIYYVNQAKDDYRRYQLTCKNNALNEYLVSLIPEKLSNMNFIEYLIKDETYSFDILQSRIENALFSDEIEDANYPEIIKMYKFISKEKPLKQLFNRYRINNILNSTTENTSEGFYDLVAMGLSGGIIDIQWIIGLDERVAERIEYYEEYGTLLILALNSSSELLNKSLKIITEKDYDDSIITNIEEIFPFFIIIKDVINVTEIDLIKRLNRWYDSLKNKITVDNISDMIPEYEFFKYSTEIENDLTKHINSIAIKKINSFTKEELYEQLQLDTYYWLKCISLLIQGEILTILPNNLTEFCKMILSDISKESQPIPTANSFLDIIINKANKNKLQPTIKSICDDFCNKSITVSPILFIYFTNNFDFINKMRSRKGDIARNILNVIITDRDCLNLVLENSADYIKIIKSVGNDAEDLKVNIRQLLQNDKSEKLQEFAAAIGVMD